MGRRFLTLVGVGLAAASGWALAAGAANATVQTSGPMVRVVVPEEEVPASADSVSVSVDVEGVEDLGAFTIVLAFDASKLDVSEVRKGPFLGSSGREVVCDDPQIENGVVRYLCVTLRTVPPEGATGSGELATILFSVHAGGRSTLDLTKVELTHPDGTPIDSMVQGAELNIERSDETAQRVVVVGAVVGAIAVIVLASWWWRGRRRAQS